MHLIKVSAINSTNSFAREMFRENNANADYLYSGKKTIAGQGTTGNYLGF